MAELIINPVGNFPLNDDWWYALTLEHFLQNKSGFVSWSAATQIGQTASALLFTKIFGSTFTALRFYSLLLSLLTIFVTYKLCFHFILKNKSWSLLSCLLLFFNPLYLSFSNSFMTEIPFLFYLLCGIYFYFSYKENNHLSFYILSTLFFILAVLTRQIGLAFVFALVVCELCLNRSNYLKIFVFLSANLLALFLFEYWLYHKDPTTAYANVLLRNGNFSGTPSFSGILFSFSKNWVYYVSTCSFLLSPILIAFLIGHIKQNRRQLINKQTLISLLIFIPVIISFRHFPIGNYIYNCGVGPDTLYDTYILGLNKSGTQSPLLFGFISVITFISSYSFILALVTIASRLFADLKNKASSVELFSALFILVSVFLYYSFLCFTSAILDRYMFISSVFLLFLFIKYLPLSISKQVFISALILLASFSVLSTKDYLNLNRARWKAIDLAKKEYQVADVDINGGYEHAGLLFSGKLNWAEKWLNSPINTFVIAHGNLPDYSATAYISYQRYLPYKTDSIFILKLNKLNSK